MQLKYSVLQYSIRCKKPVQEKACTRKCDTRSENLCKLLIQVSGARFLSKCHPY